jgi:hypothetical protein
MPEATVKKDSYLLLRKGHVDRASAREGTQMNPESKTSRVKSRSNSFFARVIFSASIDEPLLFRMIVFLYFGQRICSSHA